jgi:hypothetical protein
MSIRLWPVISNQSIPQILMGFAIGIYYRNLLSMHEFHEKWLAVILTCAFHIS